MQILPIRHAHFRLAWIPSPFPAPHEQSAPAALYTHAATYLVASDAIIHSDRLGLTALGP